MKLESARDQASAFSGGGFLRTTPNRLLSCSMGGAETRN